MSGTATLYGRLMRYATGERCVAGRALCRWESAVSLENVVLLESAVSLESLSHHNGVLVTRETDMASRAAPACSKITWFANTAVARSERFAARKM
jgi:hypothetical protein